MKPFNYSTARFSCPQCRTLLEYVGYTAFNCKHCGRGWGIDRLPTLHELHEKSKPVPMYEDEYL